MIEVPAPTLTAHITQLNRFNDEKSVASDLYTSKIRQTGMMGQETGTHTKPIGAVLGFNAMVHLLSKSLDKAAYRRIGGSRSGECGVTEKHQTPNR